MSNAAIVPVPRTLQAAQRAFTRWRRSRRRGARIPAPLWDLAVELAAEVGVSQASQALGLDYYSLKQRLEATTEVSGASPAAFVEVLPPPAPEGPGCVLEFSDGSGRRLRVVLPSSGAAQIGAVARALWEAAE